MNNNTIFEKDSVLKLLVKLSIPAVIAMTANAFYNLIDVFFIGRSSEGAVAVSALGIALPLQLTTYAIALMVGIGSASLFGRKLGQSDSNKGELSKIVLNAIISSLIVCSFVGVLLLIFKDSLLDLIGATPQNFKLASSYLGVVLIGSFFHPITVVVNNLLRAEGKAKISMFLMLVGISVNIILDYFLVIVFNKGIVGAGVATLVSQVVCFIFVAIYIFISKSTKINVVLQKPSFDIVKEIFRVGFPAFLRYFMGIVLLIVVNKFIMKYITDDSMYEHTIAIYTVISRTYTFSLLPCGAMLQALSTMTSYYFGIKKYNTIIKTVKLTLFITVSYYLVIYALAMVFPNVLINFFLPKLNVTGSDLKVFRTVNLLSPLILLQLVLTTVYDAIGKTGKALGIILFRQVFLLIGLLFLLGELLGISGLWLAFPITDGISFLVIVILFVIMIKKLGYKNRNNGIT